MTITQTSFNNLYIFTPKVFQDNRGLFFESYTKKYFHQLGLKFNFVQDNHSYTKKKYTFRGLHYQLNPRSQTTLIRVLSGKILDVVVDLRKSSPTYGQYCSNVLSAKNKKQLLIPKGFAHGFLTLTNNVNILYKMDAYYSSKFDRILNVMDKDLNINLKISWNDILMAEKDSQAPMLNEIENNFI